MAEGKAVAHGQLKRAGCREQGLQCPQHSRLQSPWSVRQRPPLGLGGCVGEWGPGFTVPPFLRLDSAQHCPHTRLHPPVQPSVPHGWSESHTLSRAHKEKSLGGHFSQLPRQASLGRFLWPNLEFQVYPGGLLGVDSE